MANAKQVFEMLILNHTAGLPTMIQGSPGIGKTSLAYQFNVYLQETLKKPCTIYMMHGPTLDSVDVQGVPAIDHEKRTTSWYKPDFLPRKGQGVLLIDELPQMMPAVQNACSQLILEGKIGNDYQLPKGFYIIATANLMGSNCATSRIPNHILDRFDVVLLETDFAIWSLWAINQNIHEDVLGFLRFKSTLLNTFDPKLGQVTFASERSWEKVSKLMFAAETVKPDNAVLSGSVAGLIGEGPCVEFVNFKQLKDDMVNPDLVLMSPDTAPIPEKPAALYALVTSLAIRANEKNVKRLMVYVGRIPIEFAVLLVKDISIRSAELVDTKSVRDWIIEHSNVFV